MSQVAPPTQQFPTIIFNPSFWNANQNSSLYLGRTGTPTSIASNTTFTGSITATDLTVANVINGTALNATNAYSASTQALGNNTTLISTTEFVQNQINHFYYGDINSNYAIQVPDPVLGFTHQFQNLTSGSSNYAWGKNSLQNVTSGIENFSIGGGSMYNLTTGNFNISVGPSCLGPQNHSYCVAIGRYALSNCDADANVGIGYFTMVGVRTGTSNCGIGHYCLVNLNNGDNNTSCGPVTGGNIVAGSYNSFFGYNANASDDYSYCTAIGYNANAGANNEIAIGTSAETTKIYGALTVVGASTFSTAPTMSGENISATTITGTSLVNSTITQGKVSNGYVDLSSAQSSIAGDKTFTGSTQINTLQYNTIFTPYSVGAITTTSTLATPLKGTYTWNATASQSITMPVITTAMIGITINFRRITTSNTFILSIIGGSGNSVLALNAITAVANPTSTPLLTSNATPTTAFFASITCINSTTWAIMA